MGRKQKRKRQEANIEDDESAAQNSKLNVSPRLSTSSSHPRTAAAAPILLLREIERCLICHFLDLPNIARLLCTSKFFSVAGSNIVLWRPVLYWNTVHLLSSGSVLSFCKKSTVICKLLIRLDIGADVCTKELFDHLLHFPSLSDLTLPLPGWLAVAINSKTNLKVEKTLEHLCTCLNSVTLLASPRLHVSTLHAAFQELLNRFGKSNIRRLCISGDKEVSPSASLEFPSMEELIIDVPLAAIIYLGSHYSLVHATYHSCTDEPYNWIVYSVVHAMALFDVHVDTLILPAIRTDVRSPVLDVVPHPLPVLRILPDGFDGALELLRAFPHVSRLELTGIRMLKDVMELLQREEEDFCPDLQQIQLIGGTMEQQQRYQLKLNKLCQARDLVEMNVDAKPPHIQIVLE